MIRRSFRHVTTAIFLLVAMLSQGTWALAGTTGGLGGSVLDADTSAPIAGAQVTATSPSQQQTTSTDASGHFVFLALAPDTYTVSVTKANYQAASVPGQTVFADSTAVVAVRLVPALKTIAKTTSLGAGSLVRSGTTADVYSVNAANRDKISALGGGGSLNSAYAAVASVPGAYVPFNQTGYFQSVHIRGGDYDQVGYEFDGVPVNRSFDNYPSSAASSLGNSEVQVYTGATPANSSGEGLAGYINQVIKTGTYPGHRQRRSRHRRAGLLSQGLGRSRRSHAGPSVLMVHGYRRLQPDVQLLRQFQRRVVPVVARHPVSSELSGRRMRGRDPCRSAKLHLVLRKRRRPR